MLFTVHNAPWGFEMMSTITLLIINKIQAPILIHKLGMRKTNREIHAE